MSEENEEAAEDAAETANDDSPANGESDDTGSEDNANEEATSSDADASESDADAVNEKNTGDPTTSPEFQELDPDQTRKPGKFQLERFREVQVALAAELGRTQLTLQALMDLTEGSVVELNREVGAPVELIAQGVALGTGEVVVIEDRFAIRVTQVYQNS